MAKKKPKIITKNRCVFEFFSSIEQAAAQGPMPYDRVKAFLPYCIKTVDGQELGSLEVSLDKGTNKVDEAGIEKMRELAHNPNFTGFVKKMRYEDYTEEKQ